MFAPWHECASGMTPPSVIAVLVNRNGAGRASTPDGSVVASMDPSVDAASLPLRASVGSASLDPHAATTHSASALAVTVQRRTFGGHIGGLEPRGRRAVNAVTPSTAALPGRAASGDQ